MKRIVLFFGTLVLSMSIFAQTNKVKEVWQTDAKLQTPESVLYYPKDNILFVSNIAGSPTGKDNTGFISKVDLEGNIVDLKWVEGISAPKGMAVNNGKLYVSNIDELVEIDIKKNEIINRYPAAGAKFLNDVAVDRNGNVYVSDMGTNKIWYLHSGLFEIWFDTDLQNPNGLYAEKDNLLVGNKDYILKINYQTKKSSKYIENTGSIDGLVPTGTGAYLISDWKEHVYLVKVGAERELIFASGKEGVNAADIEYIPSKKILLIPTFFNNRVVAYKLP